MVVTAPDRTFGKAKITIAPHWRQHFNLVFWSAEIDYGDFPSNDFLLVLKALVNRHQCFEPCIFRGR